MINEKQIAFITCVNDDAQYSTCLKYIEQIDLPKGYTYEIIGIRGAKSLASGYNEAMAKSKAKYKVYLHQDTYIVNKMFIHAILSIFTSNFQVGILGVAGAGTLRMNVSWCNSKDKYGKVIENSHGGSFRLLAFQEVTYLKAVQCVDGLFMITQYDIPWRDDIFDGWHFYDISQCMEFRRSGYEVCIPEQQEAWCIHDCGVLNKANIDKYRYVFLKEYSKELFGIHYRPVWIMHKTKKIIRLYTKKVELTVKKLIRNSF